jgi:phosphoglycolate phosphatase
MTTKVEQKCLEDGLSSLHTQMIISHFHQSIGWNTMTDNLMPSAPLSAGTWAGIIELSAQSLISAGLQIDMQQLSVWHESLGDIHVNDQPLIPQLPEFFSDLKQNGFLISICTSDDRRATDSCIRNWGIAHLIDYSICADEVLETKPSAYPLVELCTRAGIMPHECMVVGDTSADTEMGRNSNAGLIVGVLTGSGTESQLLETGAHIVLPNISFIKDLIGTNAVINFSVDENRTLPPATVIVA